MSALYEYIETYASERKLNNTLTALPLAKKLLQDVIRNTFYSGESEETSFDHCLKATRMLMRLHIPLGAREEDLLLASMICHDLLEKVDFPESGQELVTIYGLDEEILDILKRVRRDPVMTEEKKKVHYQAIREHKIAVLLLLADCSNLVEQLAAISIGEVHLFTEEMRSCVLPTCIYAIEHYQDCHGPLKIMMEKIRCLLDVTDIIANRYQKREMAYNNEILSLMEENARLRGLIERR